MATPYNSLMSLFWRIFLTNLVVVLGGAIVGTEVTRRFVQRGEFSETMHVGLIVIAIALSAGATWMGIRSAFRPLRELHIAIDAFHRGDRKTSSRMLDGGDPDLRAVSLAVDDLWRRLEEANATVAEQNKRLIALTTEVISAQEEERKRIARELHDEAGQALTALIIGLERGYQSMHGPHLTNSRDMVGQLRDLAVQTLEEVRNLAFDLRPSLLDDVGLVATLRWYARTSSTRNDLPIDVSVEGFADGDRLSPDVETTVFRIVQEGLTNIAKHAQAHQAWVTVRRDAHGLSILVADDGVGIGSLNPDESHRDGHLGLFGMIERARLFGGEMSIGLRPGGGTILALTLPVSAIETSGPLTPDRAQLDFQESNDHSSDTEGITRANRAIIPVAIHG